MPHKGGTTTSTIGQNTTTVQSTSYLSSCGTISSPGSYFLSSDIKYTAVKGACFNVTTNYVSIECNGHSIVGSGPFASVMPFSYGIYTSGTTGVSVDGCTIDNFSYGVYEQSSQGLNLTNSHITNNYMSNLYIGSSSGGNIANDNITYSISQSGAVLLTNGSNNNRFYNNNLKFNAFYGFNISSINNNFIGNKVNGSQDSFLCAPSAGFPSSNLANGNSCYNQSGCDWIKCGGNNAPLNVSKVTLQSVVSSCGSINLPGRYSMSSSLNMHSFSEASLSVLQQYNIPCIRINAPNVNLQCNGFAISNAYVGIDVRASNVSLNNCQVFNSTTGVRIGSFTGTHVTNAVFSGDNSSVSLQASTGSVLQGITSDNNTYGMYMKNASSNIFNAFSTNYNQYGIYLTNSLGNIFTHGAAFNNTKYDIFATLDSANQSSNLMSATACGFTDTKWATCTQYTSNTASTVTELSSCSDIKRPGSYVLTITLPSATNECMKIDSSNVRLNCNFNQITTSSSQFQPGPAIWANGRSNITISNCTVGGFNSGISVYNSTDVQMNNDNGSSLLNYGITLKNDSNSRLTTLKVIGTENYSIGLIGSTNITLQGSNTSLGNQFNDGLFIDNTTRSKIINNLGYRNFDGIDIVGNSTNNTVYGNAYTGNLGVAYECDARDSGLGAENGGVNTGSKKTNCKWLAAIPLGSSGLPCQLASQPNAFILTQDYAYGFGATCLTITGNGTTINCQGHTILATNGGTLAAFNTGAGQGILENCFLKGFSTPITASNTLQLEIYNNTIYQNTSSVNPNVTVINVSKSSQFKVLNNNVFTHYSGIGIYQDTQGSVLNNNVTAFGTAYSITGTLTNYTTFSNNTAHQGSGIGALISGPTLLVLKNNNFFGIVSGLWCLAQSQGSTNNTDGGNNYCSSNRGCAWIQTSSSTCH